MSPWKFEELIGGIFKEHFDCQVALTKKTRDGGKDLICFDSQRGKFYVEVKNPRSAKKTISLAVVQRFIGVLYQDQVTRGLLVTSTSFTKEGKAAAEKVRDRLELSLCDQTDVLAWLGVLRETIDENLLMSISKALPRRFPRLNFKE